MSEPTKDEQQMHAIVWLACFLAANIDPKKETIGIPQAAEHADLMVKEFFNRYPPETFT